MPDQFRLNLRPSAKSADKMPGSLRGSAFSALLRLERIKKNRSHPVEWQMKPGLLPFGFVSAQSQGFQTCSFAKASPKGKIPDSEWLQFFLNRSSRVHQFEDEAIMITIKIKIRRVRMKKMRAIWKSSVGSSASVC
jgi:hypothetical protein